jgi:hypothetical protein
VGLTMAMAPAQGDVKHEPCYITTLTFLTTDNHISRTEITIETCVAIVTLYRPTRHSIGTSVDRILAQMANGSGPTCPMKRPRSPCEPGTPCLRDMKKPRQIGR